MRALVISGGGSKGAFAGGIAEFLIKECQFKYDLFVGTSTGSLLIPHLAIDEIDKIKKVYTSVKQEDIFSTCPFIITKENDKYKTRINHWGIVKLFIRGTKTFGDSNNLLKLIKKNISKSDFRQMKANHSDIVVTVSNLSTNQVEYKSIKESNYEDFCDWIWASSNMVPFMSLLEKNNMEYADGGMADLVPISESIRRGATELDIIVLKTNHPRSAKRPTKNAMELTTRTFDFMLNQISNDDILIGKLQGSENQVKLNFYYPPKSLTENSLIFNPEEMKKWWEEGYNFAKSFDPVCKCIEPTSYKNL
ncbi:patatin-like phospholipase family protein [Echinicola sp. CAU 1574]|uniref:Patatin-like phospholipase family protein n=1 Tax=Echinicola arenosa TaxID=2774144 RepID=A0ABR9ANY7_9BACT|nr:patatin-like phospholipase family protein [Echinicola arenosa]MBD8490511.1 patatin-like phospholipase family protein [Echinicola arenosa]